MHEVRSQKPSQSGCPGSYEEALKRGIRVFIWQTKDTMHLLKSAKYSDIGYLLYSIIKSKVWHAVSRLHKITRFLLPFVFRHLLLVISICKELLQWNQDSLKNCFALYIFQQFYIQPILRKYILQIIARQIFNWYDILDFSADTLKLFSKNVNYCTRYYSC